MTQYEQLVEEHGSIRKAAKAAGVSYSTFHQRLRAGTPTTTKSGEAPPTDALKAIDLTNRRVSDKRPPTTVKAKLYGLKKGRGYPITEAARDWGVSVENLRRHARDLDAVFFVEASPEEWVEVVTYPKRG
jgi:predicted DNA binding protein